jgi:Transcriptional regulators
MHRLPKTLDRSAPIRIGAANLLQEAILSGQVKPGQEIPQLPLAKRLGLSQSSVREALQELEYRGVIRKRGRNWIVTELSEGELAGLYEVRALLEPYACRLAAMLWTDAGTAQLEECMRRMRNAAARRNYRDHWNADIEFHQTIWRVQPNRSLERQLNLVCMPIFAHGVLQHAAIPASSYQRSLRWHALILDLLRQRDAAGVEQAVRRIVRGFHRLNLKDFGHSARAS